MTKQINNIKIKVDSTENVSFLLKGDWCFNTLLHKLSITAVGICISCYVASLRPGCLQLAQLKKRKFLRLHGNDLKSIMTCFDLFYPNKQIDIFVFLNNVKKCSQRSNCAWSPVVCDMIYYVLLTKVRASPRGVVASVVDCVSL